jgi:hypothetical protein
MDDSNLHGSIPHDWISDDSNLDDSHLHSHLENSNLRDSNLDFVLGPLPYTVYSKDDFGGLDVNFVEEQPPKCDIWTYPQLSVSPVPILQDCCDLCQSLWRACMKAFSLDEDEDLAVAWRTPNICEIWVGRLENRIIRVFSSRSKQSADSHRGCRGRHC